MEDEQEEMTPEERDELIRLSKAHYERNKKYLHAETDNEDGTQNWHDIPRDEIEKIELDTSVLISIRNPCTVYMKDGRKERYFIHSLAVFESCLIFKDESPWAFALNEQWDKLLKERFGKSI